MHRRLFFVLAALTMVLSVFTPMATAGEDVASAITAVDSDSITLDSTYTRAAVVDRNGQKLVSVIIKLEGEPLATYRGDISGLPATSPSVTGEEKLNTRSLEARRYRQYLAREHTTFERSLKAALPASEITGRFDLVLGGVSALVPIDEVKTVENMDGVQAVWLDQMVEMDTDTSPGFIGADTAWEQLGGVDEAGEGVIVGVIDSGVWPEHPSFADDGSFPAPPAGWAGTACDFGNTAYNPNDVPFTCNNKLIGAADFTQTYVAVVGLLPTEFESARDSNGHGTHTASTAAGNSGVVSTVLGSNLGTVSGIAPRAHVAVYKACGADGCFNSDTTAAVQQAVEDGVDTLNYSISGGGDPYNESTSIAFWGAFQAGVVVTPSAGNSGPGADTVAHREPWTMTVGASTHNRTYESTATITGVAKGYDSQVTVLHGIPALDVDVYVNGALLLPEFKFGDDAGPLDLPPGDYAIDIYGAGADPTVDSPALSAVVPVGLGVNATIVAHLAADGTPTASVLGNDDSAVAAGEGRLSVSHTAAAPAVDVVLADDTVVFANLANGERQSADLPAGTYDVYVTPTGGGVAGAVAGPLPVEVLDGVIRNVFAVGDLAGGTFGVDIIDLAPVSGEMETLEIVGNTITGGIATPTPVVVPTEDPLCLEAFPAGRFNGEIVICERGVIARVEKSFNVAAGGGSGMLFYNPVLQGTALDNHFIPSVHFEFTEGELLTSFFATHSGVMASFTDGAQAVAQGDVMAAFSSRGGPAQSLGISKPDITAPGVQINAGNTPLPENVVGGVPGQLFQVIGGTSMSAPHGNGVAALVIQANPDWSPSQVKSAIMLTALTDGVTKEDGVTPADTYDYGSGRVMPARAINSPLTMHTDGMDYVTYADNLWNTNYPSIYIPVMPGQISTQRTFTNSTGSWARWNVVVDAPSDLVIDADRRFYVRPNGSATIDIDIDASAVPLGETRFAAIYLTNGSDTLRMPVTVVRNQPDVTLDHSCESDELEVRDTMICTIAIENTSLEDASVDLSWRAPRQLKLGDVFGARKIGGVKVQYSETLAGAEPPTPTISDAPGSTPAGGYLPMAALGVAPQPAFGDEQIANYNIPTFVYGGVEYSQIGVVSNGYVVVGGGDGADVDYINSDLPNAAQPNNTLAAFWTDLDPSKGGDIYVALVGDGVNSWVVVEFENIPNWSDAASANTFQVWIGVNGTEDITYTYGNVTAGDGGFLTVGAEDATGTRGDMIYFDGVGTAPSPNAEFLISSLPGSPGGSHVIQMEVEGKRAGMFRSVAEMTSDSFYGTSTGVVEGTVVGGPPLRIFPGR